MSDVWVALIAGLLFLGAIVWFAFLYHDGADKAFILLAGTSGSALGWVIGIMASPYNQKEKGAFSDMAKLTYGFLSGYVVSKVDPVLKTFLPAGGLASEGKQFLVLVTVALTGFMVVFAVTFVSRTYWAREGRSK